MALQLPRLQSSVPVIGPGNLPAIGFINWWNVVCNAIEGAVNSLTTQQAQIQANELAIDKALGIAQDASETAGGVASIIGGISTLPAHSVLLSEGAMPIAGVSPGAAGGVLTSTGTSSDPTFQLLSVVLDTAFGTTEGSVIYRGATAWEALGPGMAGTKLTTNGAGAPPTWT